jgi:hypothetical protein
MYRCIDPMEKTYQKVVGLRVSEGFYKWFNHAFGNRIGTFPPFRWALHRNIKVPDQQS